ncbi:MAG: DUF2332 domain-containing protein [Gammaproteobacteria bacterium]
MPEYSSTAEQLERDARDCAKYARGLKADGAALAGHLTEALGQDREWLAMARRVVPLGQPVNLILFSGVNYLLMERPERPLADLHPAITRAPCEPAAVVPLVRDFCMRHEARLRALLATRTTQYTVVQRGAYVLPALSWLAGRIGAPLTLIEVGCSAGLNLLFDAWNYDYGAFGRVATPGAPFTIACRVEPGSAPLPLAVPAVTRRVGIDLQLFDPDDPDQLRWLIASLHPDLPAEREMVERALELRRNAGLDLMQADAMQVLPDLLAQCRGPVCVLNSHCIYQWPEALKARLDQVLLDAAAAGARVQRISVEMLGFQGPPTVAPARVREKDIEIRAIDYGGGVAVSRVIGYTHVYGRWIDWLAEA